MLFRSVHARLADHAFRHLARHKRLVQLWLSDPHHYRNIVVSQTAIERQVPEVEQQQRFRSLFEVLRDLVIAVDSRPALIFPRVGVVATADVDPDATLLFLILILFMLFIIIVIFAGIITLITLMLIILFPSSCTVSDAWKILGRL